jgi:hypothetical protein
MGKGRFLNQKLGKQANRRLDLLKSKVTAQRGGHRVTAGARLPKKGASRQDPEAQAGKNDWSRGLPALDRDVWRSVFERTQFFHRDLCSCGQCA